MKFLLKSLGVFVTLMVLTSTFATSENSHEVVKYVQGGARPGGNGSKKRPFSSLADAEQHNWDVLFVLSSPFDLDGGITLKPGQKLIGEEDPTGIAVSPTQPTIINTGTTHGGNGVVVTGDATIKNIFFNNTNNGGIDTTQAENLTVQNVRITGFNQNPAISSFGIGGFEQKSGETRLENVIISNPNGTGFAGILESLSSDGIHRKLSLCNCEFTQLNQGIFTQVVNPDTTSTIKIENSYFHDFFADGIGIFGLLFNNSQQTMLVKNSTFYNVGVGNGAVIFVESEQTSQLELKVDSSSFEEILIPNTVQAILIESFDNSSITTSIEHSTFNSTNWAIQPISSGTSSIKMVVEHATFNNTPSAIEPISSDTSSIETIVKNSTGNNVGSFFTPLLFDAQQTNKLCGNTVSGGVFYNTSTGSSSAVEVSTLEGNVFNGLTGFLVESPPAGVAWKLLDITAEDNCFNGGNASGSNAFLVQSGNSGNIAIRAHENSFSEFSVDIVDQGTNTNYLVSENFWGTPTVSCTPTGCEKYQVCENNRCLGPTTNLTIPGFSGFIDASNPLSTSINCPSSFCPSPSGILTSLPQTINRSAEEMRAILETKKAVPVKYQPTETV